MLVASLESGVIQCARRARTGLTPGGEASLAAETAEEDLRASAAVVGGDAAQRIGESRKSTTEQTVKAKQGR